jgi:hypothetical protein
MLPRWNRSAPLAASVLVACGALVACGGDDSNAPKKDASTDTGPPPPDTMCGADTFYTGETIDWDSNSTTFCGVFQATVKVRSSTQIPMNTTNPNGRFPGICVSHQAGTLVDIIPPATSATDPTVGASQCPSHPGTYPKAGILIVDPAVIDAGGAPSLRILSTTAMARMFSPTGPIKAAYNPMEGDVVIHFVGTPHAVTTSATDFDLPQQFNGTLWEPVAGAQAPGSDVLFPNVGATQAITFNIAGGTPSSVTLTPVQNMNPDDPTATLVADKFTYVTVVTP